MNEIWKPIINFEKYYEVSSQGRIKRTAKGNGTWPGRILKQALSKNGYSQVYLCKNNKMFFKQVHRLILESFYRLPKIKEQCNHKNGIKDDNRLENLEWVSQSQNQKHRYETLGHYGLVGSKNPNSKLTKKEVLEIRQLCEKKQKLKDIAKKFNVTFQTISDIKRQKTWKHI